MPVYAGIDIGTLTLRLLIARVDTQGRLEEIVSERRIVRLGEGLQPTRRLQPAPMRRAIDAIRSWMPVIQREAPEVVIAVATSAVRDAVNREDFLQQIKRALGLDVEIITGEEEARRTLLGIRAGLPSGVDRFVALDIGGGSTEFIKVSPEQSPAMISIDEGVVRLREGCLRSDPVRAEELSDAGARIRALVDMVIEKLGPAKYFQLVGTAGTITTLAAMNQRLAEYNRSRLHNYRLTLESVRKIVAELVPRTLAERGQLVGLERGREDLILAGALILLEVMESSGFPDCLVSEYGLREGLLIDRWQRNQTQV